MNNIPSPSSTVLTLFLERIKTEQATIADMSVIQRKELKIYEKALITAINAAFDTVDRDAFDSAYYSGMDEVLLENEVPEPPDPSVFTKH